MIRAPVRALAAPLLLAGLAALPAHAQDARLLERLYDPTQVVKIEGKAGVQTTIRFGKDETIENVAIGDSQKWQVTPNRGADHLFVKPLDPRAVTNMTVVTNKRTYLFDLVAGASTKPLYLLSFTYPVEIEPVEAADAAPQRASEVEMAAATDPYAVIDPAALNFDWSRQGTASLLPERVYDDGSATFLVWPAGSALPAILVRDHEGTEGPVNYAVRGELIVLDIVPREIILRAGEEDARLTNNGPARPPLNSEAALAARTASSPETDR